MRIKKVIMQNVKGKDHVQELTGRDIIIGQNGSGKTTVHQTIGIAIQGYVPGQGKTPGETYKLSSAETMGAGLVLDNLTFTRSFTKSTKIDKKDGSTSVKISQDIMLSPGQGENDLNQKQARIYAEVGNFPVMLDFSEFLKLSDAKRREFIYNLSPIDVKQWDKERIEKYLVDSLLTLELKTNNPDKYNITHKTIAETIAAFPAAYDVQAGLTAMIDFVKTKISYWNEEKKKSDGAVSKLAELKNKLEETDRNIANNKKELEELQKKLVDLSALIAKDTERKKAIGARLQKITDLKEGIEKIKAEECPHNVVELQKQISEKNALIKADFAYGQQRADIQVEIDSNKKSSDAKQVEYTNKLDIRKKAEYEYKSLQDTLKTIQGNEITKGTVVTHKCVISPLINCEKDFSKYINHTTEKINDLQKKAKTADAEAMEIFKDITALQEKNKQLEKDKDASYKNENDHTSHNNRLRNEITLLETYIKAAGNFDINKADRIKDKEEELKKLESEAKVEEGIIDLETAETQKAGYESSISTLKAKVDEQNKAKVTITSLQTSMLDNKQAAFYADAYKLIGDLLGAKGIQGEIVKSILEPIRSDIQAKLDKLNLNVEFFFNTESDTGREVFQFGWIKGREDKWQGIVREYRNFDALSTGEQLLLLCSMMITIIERSNPRLKLLEIDNINDLDAVNFRKFILALNEIGGNMDNILLSGVVEQYLKNGDKILDNYEGFKVWNLSEAITV